MAAVTPNKSFNADRSAKELNAAMKGIGTNEKALIAIIASHTIAQRLLIAESYKAQFGKELIPVLKAELKGDFENTILALMQPTAVFLAIELARAMVGPGTDESTLIEILCAHKNSEIHAISKAYGKITERALDDALRKETSGTMTKLLVFTCLGNRDESDHVDKLKAKEDAAELYKAGENKFGTDESVFFRIICGRSFAQLREIFDCYKEISGHDIEEAIKKETRGKIEEGFTAIAKYAKDPGAFFAERLYKSMKGLGTDEKALIRLIVSRSEIDLERIAKKFAALYGKPLNKFISSETSGDFKALLIAIVGDN